MTFSTVTLAGSASGGSGYLSTTGTFTAQVTGNADGSVSGSWSFDGTYRDSGYYGTSGTEKISGTLSGTGSPGGPWTLTLVGGGVISEGLTMSYANGQYTLQLAAGFAVDYSVFLGYGETYGVHDEFNFAAQLVAAGAAPAGTAAGTAGNDQIVVAATGSSSYDGGAGIDTAVFADVRANYAVVRNGDGTYSVSHGSDTDTFANVERLQFADAKLAIDIGGDGGQAYRLYQAAFDRTPDTGGLGYWINVLDQGATLPQVAAAFIASAEFASNYGALDNQHFVTQLYVNALHREPDAGGLAYWQALLDQATLTRAQVLVFFSESAENQANVIGQIQNGMLYTP